MGAKVAMWIYPYADVQGRYFMHTLSVIETVEVGLQTIQAYGFSLSIAHAGLVAYMGIMVWCNCWSTPLITFWGSRQPRNHRNLVLMRLLCLVADSVLDFAWGFILQCAFFIRFWRLYMYLSNPSPGEPAPFALGETAQWELELVVVVSWTNFVFGVFPFLTSTLAMREIVSIINHQQMMSLDAHQVAAVHPLETAEDDGTQACRTEVAVAVTKKRSRLTWMHAYHALLMSYGVGILIITIAAINFEEPEGCIVRLFPWFMYGSAPICVGRFINCASHGIAGRRDEIEPILDRLPAYLPGRLEFINCKALEFPRGIQRFTELASINLYKVVVVKWSEDARLDGQSLPRLRVFTCRLVRFASHPNGLLTHALPPTFERLYFSYTDVTPFIDLVTNEWQSVAYFQCVRCGIDRIPAAVNAMSSLRELTLTENNIAVIEEGALADQQWLLFLSLAANALTSLPDSIWKHASGNLAILYVAYTRIDTIPAFVNDDFVQPRFAIYAEGSPLCHPERFSVASALPSFLMCPPVYA